MCYFPSVFDNILKERLAFWIVYSYTNIYIYTWILPQNYLKTATEGGYTRYLRIDMEKDCFNLQLLEQVAECISEKCLWRLTFYWILIQISMIKRWQTFPCRSATTTSTAAGSVLALQAGSRNPPAGCLGVVLRMPPLAHDWRRLSIARHMVMHGSGSLLILHSYGVMTLSPAEAHLLGGKEWGCQGIPVVWAQPEGCWEAPKLSPAFPSEMKDQDVTTHLLGSLLTFQIYFHTQPASTLPHYPSGGTSFLICN